MYIAERPSRTTATGRKISARVEISRDEGGGQKLVGSWAGNAIFPEPPAAVLVKLTEAEQLEFKEWRENRILGSRLRREEAAMAALDAACGL